MNTNWLLRRSLMGLVEIVSNSLQTMRGILPNSDEENGATPAQLRVTEAVYQVQVAVGNLAATINKLDS